MFREMRRCRQQMTSEECIDLLEKGKRGVLAVLGDEDYPYTVPMDYFYDTAAGQLYFHSAKKGHKLDAVQKHDKVSFCVLDEGYRENGDWAYHFHSVVVFGRLHIADTPEKNEAILRKLGLKYFPDAEYVEKELRKNGKNAQCLILSAEHISGKTVYEK